MRRKEYCGKEERSARRKVLMDSPEDLSVGLSIWKEGSRFHKTPSERSSQYSLHRTVGEGSFTRIQESLFFHNLEGQRILSRIDLSFSGPETQTRTEKCELTVLGQ